MIKKPIIDTGNNYFKVVFPNLNYIKEENLYLLKKEKNDELDGKSNMILDLMEKYQGIEPINIAMILNESLEITKKRIDELERKKIISQIGTLGYKWIIHNYKLWL